MVNNIGSISFFGFLCSQVYSGFLADRFGRTPLLFVTVACCAVMGYIIAYFNALSFNVYIAGRFFMMFFNCQCYIA